MELANVFVVFIMGIESSFQSEGVQTHGCNAGSLSHITNVGCSKWACGLGERTTRERSKH